MEPDPLKHYESPDTVFISAHLYKTWSTFLLVTSSESPNTTGKLEGHLLLTQL